MENKETNEFGGMKYTRLENNVGNPVQSEDDYLGDGIFQIVVDNLKERGLEIPNNDIYAFRKMYSGKNAISEIVVIRFKGGTSLHISVSDDRVVAMVGEQKASFDTYQLTDADEKKYREKYLPYALEFLAERERVLENKSKLGSERLSRLGI